MSTPTPVPDQPAGEPPDPLVGRLFADRYRIIRKLGEGAMGAVYVGEHQHIGRLDAIKVLRPGLAGDAEAIRRFTRGTRNVSAIRHPNVCTVYDFSDTPEGVRYLAMEFVEGDTLKEVLDREGRLPLERAVEITRQVAEALQAAHEAGVVHRDLKPGNIMLCRRPDGREQVKVVDFDIAKGPAEAEGEEVTRVGFVVGTPEYMSPEQLTGDRLDGRSDLYSLGVVLFRMLTGQLPFRAENTQEIMIQRLTTEPLHLHDASPDLVVPPALEQALHRALARLARDRQPSAGQFGEEVVAALAAGQAAAPAPAAPAARPPQVELAPTQVAPSLAVPLAGTGAAAPPGRKRSPVLIVGVALAVVAAAAVGAMLLRPHQEAGGPATPPDTTSHSVAVLPAGSDAPQDSAAAPPVQPPTDPGNAPAGQQASESSGSQPTSQPGSRPATRQPAGQPGPTAGAGRTALPAGGVVAMLNRQLGAVVGASGAQLRAVRDSALLGWQLAGSRADSAAAAYVMAQAEFAADDNGECLRWARRAASLGEGAAQTLVKECQ